MNWIVAFAFICWLMPPVQTSRQPSKRVSEKESSTSGKLATDSSNTKVSPDTETLKAILGVITKEQQKTADNQNNEATLEKENIRAEWWLVGVGFAQTIALIGTLWAVWYQAKKTAVAAMATEKAANAAWLNAQAVLDSERAWVEASIVRDKQIYFLKIANQGKTPAYIEGYDIHRGPFKEGNKFTPEGLDDSYTVNLAVLLGSGNEYEPRHPFDMTEYFQGSQGKQAFCIKVRYRDVLNRPSPSDSTHESLVVYTFIFTSGILPMNRISELSKYT